MMTLHPRRDAITRATTAARSAAASLPPAKNRVEEINREIAHGVLESALIPVAEAMDLGADGSTASAMLVNAFANVLVSFCLSCSDGDVPRAEQHALVVLDALIDRTRGLLAKPAEIEVVEEFRDIAPGRAQ